MSGNRNFEGRVNPQTRGNWLASPPLVVAYALAGTVDINFKLHPIGHQADGTPVYLRDLWPSNDEIKNTIAECLNSDMFKNRYKNVFLGEQQWQDLETTDSQAYAWSEDSTYIANPPYFQNMTPEAGSIDNIYNAKPLLVLGDSITTVSYTHLTLPTICSV